MALQQEILWIIAEQHALREAAQVLEQPGGMRALLNHTSNIEGRLAKLRGRAAQKAYTPETLSDILRTIQLILQRLSHIDGSIITQSKAQSTDYARIKEELQEVTDIYLERLTQLLQRATAHNPLAPTPFLAIIHGANDKDLIRRIHTVNEQQPTYRGRHIQLCAEVDYTYITTPDGIHGYFTHAPHGLEPRSAKQLLAKRGTSDPAAVMDRKGLFLPQHLLSTIGRVRLVIEIKSGVGSVEHGLNHLINLVKRYHLEESIIFLSFSYQICKYLKERLPRAYTITNILRTPFGKLNLPLNLTYEPWHRIIPLVRAKSLIGTVDAQLTPIGSDAHKTARLITTTHKEGFHFIGGQCRSKEQLHALLDNGADGALIWATPEHVNEWLTQN